jgi:hypothetical protein
MAVSRTGIRSPDPPVEHKKIMDRTGDLLQPVVVDRLAQAEAQIAAALLHLHVLRMGDLALGIDDEGRVAEVVAQPRRDREAHDDIVEFVADGLVERGDLGEALHQVEPCPRRVQRGEDDGGRPLVGAEQQHQQVDEQALVVRPRKIQVAYEVHEG